MTASVAERVAAGAAFLDEREPGWADHVNLDALALESCWSCVLGQVFYDRFREMGTLAAGEFGSPYGLASNQLNFESGWALGFDGRFSCRDDDPVALTAEWKQLISERRSAS